MNAHPTAQLRSAALLDTTPHGQDDSPSRWLHQTITGHGPSPSSAPRPVITGSGSARSRAAYRHGEEPRGSPGPARCALRVAYQDGVTKLRELIAEATEARAQVITLGLILGAQEGATSVMSWRSVNPGTARYLLLLEANGYPLSNVERRASGKDPLPEADD